MLESIQGKIAQTGDRPNMIVSDMDSKLIRFTCNVFEQRKQRIPGHTVYLADLESEDAGKNGRVPASKQRSRANGSADGIPCPLKVYRGKTFVEPRDVIGALTGAVVEVYFGMRHYYLRDKKCDTFQAEIQQIRIVKPGSSIATSGFKRRGACEGPLDVMCNVGLTNGGDKDVCEPWCNDGRKYIAKEKIELGLGAVEAERETNDGKQVGMIANYFVVETSNHRGLNEITAWRSVIHFNQVLPITVYNSKTPFRT
ncbi:hypothetical protein M405DRAFT_876830 [Rhizopogon salebrosus TDB-379]|nr:hypothetical protein M405DRAFT_876830 [Rhizopogon salebrosus TDB-379]